MQGLCKLSFAVEPLSNDEPVRSIVLIVNGIRLTTLIAEFEREHLYDDPAGGYAGLIPEYFNFGPLDRYFMGASADSLFAGGRYYLLSCECGEVGCWPLEARIISNEQQVSWEDFAQPFRPERDYSTFGPFRFDLDQYRKAAFQLASEFPTSGAGTGKP